MPVIQLAILTLFVALSILLVIGYAHEDKVVNFEDKLLLKIKKALRHRECHKGKNKNTCVNYTTDKTKCQPYDQDRPWAEALNYFNNGGKTNDSKIIS